MNAHAWAVTYQTAKGVNGGAAVYVGAPQGTMMQGSGMQSQQMMNSGSAYTGTIYEPFTNTTPSEASNPANGVGPRRISQDGRNPGDATESTTEFPIGEPWVLLLFAAAYGGIIMIRQRQKSKSTNMKNSTNKFIATLSLLLTLGVGQMWAASETTLYYAISEATLNSELSGHSDYKVYARVNYVGSGNDWASIEMSNTGETYNGDLLFTCTFTDKYSGLGALYFKIGVPESDSGTFSDKIWGNEEWKPFTDTKYNKTIQVHGNLGLSNKKTYAIDKTIYVYDSEGWGTMYLYTYNESHDGSWPGCGPDASPYHVTSLGSGWYQVTIMGAANFILNNGKSGDGEKKTSDLDNDEDFAQWGSYTNASTPAEEKLTASFNMQSHGSEISDQSINYNGKISEPSEPSATGYTFGGWYDEAACGAGHEWNFNTAITADKELFAKWTAKTTTVTLNPNGATTGSDQVVTATYDANMPTTTTSSTTVTAPSKTGYTFGGYYDTSASSGGKQYYTDAASPASANTWDKDQSTADLYARWTAETYTADNNLNKNNSDASGSSNGKYTATYDAPTIAINTAPTRKGYRVEGYYQEPECTHKIADASGNLIANTDYTDAGGKWNVTSNQTLYVNWTPNWYIFGKGAEFGNETTDWSEGAMTYSASNTVQAVLTLTAGTTYEFKIYKNGGTYWNNATDITSSNVTASVSGKNLYYSDSRFMSFVTSASGNYTFTLNIADESSDSGPVLSITYPSGTTYTVTYGQADFNDNSATPSNKIGAAGNTVTAVDNYGKTVGSGKKILNGGNVTLTATPITGYSFVGWYTDDDCTTGEVTTNPYTISSVSGNVEYYAKFKENICTVRITASNYTFGDITVDGEPFDWGSTKTVGVTTTHNLVATPKEGYYFAGWVKSDGADFELQNDTGDEDAEVTLAGLGGTDGSIGTLTASFMPLDKIYFRNYNEETGANLWGAGSTNLYVYFYAYWDEGGKGAGAKAKPYAQMQPIEPSSNIYWAYVPRGVTKTSASDKSHVAFSDVDFSGYDNFNGYHGVYRTDYNRITNMFVPNHTGTDPKNNTQYNNTGFWMQYNPQKGFGAGYYMQKWVEAGGYTQVAEMKPVETGSTMLHFTLTIDDVTEDNNKYMILSAGGVKYWPKENGAAVTVTSDKCTDLDLHEDGGTHPCFVIRPTVKGEYNFTVDQSGDVMKISVEYPESAVAGDYRLENAYNDGSAKTTHSNIIKAANAGSSNTVSMYLCGEGSGTLKLQKCTGISEGEPTWDEGDDTNLSDVLTTVGANKGVYYFDITIDENKVAEAPTPITKYTGDYYIHVNASTRNHLDEGEPKWSSSIGNKFTHFTKNTSLEDTYDYYWVDWFLSNSEGGGAQSVVATIGNDYNDDLAGKTPAGSTTTAGANVRYAYDSETNTFTRAMITGGGSDIKISNEQAADEVLIKVGEDYEDCYNAEKSARDIDNWMYSFVAKVKPNSEANITSTYDGDPQTLASGKKLIGGSGSSYYEVEITYDFKTDRLIAAWNPDGATVTEAIDLLSNLMVVREENGTASIINLSGGGALNEITQIYTVMEFGKYTWNGADRTISGGGYTDAYYWISLPYDCKVSDIFGIEGYGDHWTIQTYMGDLRAKSGWWAEIDNWWYNLDPEDTMEAGVGYVLRMTNLGYGPFAQEGVTKARLYFPSDNATNMAVEQLGSSTTTKLDTLICHVWRKWKNDPNKRDGEGNPTYDRRAIDSNWRILGSPSFNSTSISGDPVFLVPDDPGTDEDDLTWEDYKDSCAIRYLYTWEVDENKGKYTVTSTDGFEFKGTYSYLVQYAGTITWRAYDSGNPLVGFKAPKRYEETSLDRDFRFVLSRNGKQADVAYVSLLEEGATPDYDLNMDLSKMMNSKQANLYTIAGHYQMAGNCLPISDGITVVPVGVKLAQDGEYTFSMPEGTNGVGVTLVDNVSGERTNLALTDYAVNMAAGQYDERFFLEISPIQNTPTDIENTRDDQQNIRKVMVDGILYIVKDGKVFDARGNRVQ